MLSALELNGFKSFADRTRLEFPSGITVVVGPNGSGKSNVVDAIKWVLGSQSVKALRGKEMTDVIFGGSRTRRQANAAEASLVLDNSAGLIDHDAREIQVTRRVYRSGEGEYLINRQPCRLRDVRDLLASAGISTSGYSIIEQGRVDAVLQSTPKERRLIFEEAAGISRFRLKREEAARRLERVQQSLLRLGDIVEEVQTRLKTVRGQAARAQRYTEVAARIEQLRTQLGLADWQSLTQQIGVLEQAASRDEAAAADFQAQLAECDQRVAAIDHDAEQLSQDQRISLTADASLRERLAQCESNRSSQLARIDELQQEVVRLSHQLLTLTSRAGDSQQLVADTTAELAASQSSLAVLRLQFDAGRSELSLAEASLAELTGAAAALAAELEEARREQTQLHNESQVTEAKLTTAEAALAARDEELAPLAESRAKLGQDARQATADLTRLQAQLDQATRELATAQSALTLDRAQLAATEKRGAELSGRLTGASERTAVLEELESRLDGLTAGAKEVLRQSREEPEGQFRHIRGVVADLLHVDADTAPLIEIALGERANHLVVTETKSLAAALAGEPHTWPGRTTFLRLDVPHAASAVDRVDLSNEPGVMGRADSFVDTDAELAPLVRRLLGRHWLVDSFATAVSLAGGAGRGLNFVTVAGEAILADGTLTVGPRQSASGMLSRRSELRALRDEIESLKLAAAEAERDGRQLERRVAEQDAAARQLTAAHASMLQSHAAAQLRAASLSERLLQVEQRTAAVTAEHESLSAQIDALRRQRGGSETRLQELTTICTRCETALADHATRHAELESHLNRLRQIQTDQRVELARGEQRVEGLERQMEQLARDHAERDRALEETRQRAAQCQTQRASLQQSVESLATEIGAVQQQRLALSGRTAQLERQRSELLAQRAGAVTVAEGARRQVVAAQGRLSATRLELQQCQQQRNTLADRLRDDYKIDLPALAAAQAAPSTSQADTTTAPAPPSAPPAPLDRHATETEIQELRDRLNSGGPVNLESLAELAELEGRSGGLVAKFEDLQHARERLEQIVHQINGQSRQLFADAVTEVRGHFQEIFRRLFAGGEAEIVLEDDESGDILECGVSIVARPPGKQPRNISLLSGGERTLTCVALLLAIFRSRPSPFCVLDEVDAALDEANIDRFVKLLQEFNASTQFIVITHSKRTMTCADTLHGITMQESGISKRVSVRFEDVGEDGRIHIAATRGDAGSGLQSRAA